MSANKRQRYLIFVCQRPPIGLLGALPIYPYYRPGSLGVRMFFYVWCKMSKVRQWRELSNDVHSLQVLVQVCKASVFFLVL